jgi:hypothetical protein
VLRRRRLRSRGRDWGQEKGRDPGLLRYRQSPDLKSASTVSLEAIVKLRELAQPAVLLVHVCAHARHYLQPLRGAFATRAIIQRVSRYLSRSECIRNDEDVG